MCGICYFYVCVCGGGGGGGWFWRLLTFLYYGNPGHSNSQKLLLGYRHSIYFHFLYLEVNKITWFFELSKYNISNEPPYSDGIYSFFIPRILLQICHVEHTCDDPANTRHRPNVKPTSWTVAQHRVDVPCFLGRSLMVKEKGATLSLAPPGNTLHYPHAATEMTTVSPWQRREGQNTYQGYRSRLTLHV